MTDLPALTSLAALAGHVHKGIELGRCGWPGNDSLVDLHGLEGLVAMQSLRLNED